MARPDIHHVDKLGCDIKVDDLVVAPYSGTSLVIAKVTKLNPKMLTLRQIGKKWQFNRYPAETVVINDGNAVMYVLKNDIR